ncbi:restriction endonuclease subunit S [Micromonospora sagamiensis]|uniref:Type I restriction enzyme S subunit n=1 Tax=Micromonospora sagamiensis TaxID=47875 RepID=A0A562WEB7_9ACTN|nr:restriction endonuclease subunit S [Micromonospora sagamiensis]TWJ28217.1 type I restriction enzyme S subunit [Micromonospora sagamiensis]BCL12892.1 polypeptide HsdS [Micromonospora sagamiensis]
MTDLPSGWEYTTLGEIADTALGKMLDRAKSSGRHLRPYLRNVNVQWGRIDQSDVLTMDIPPEQEDRFRLVDGDLLVCEGGEIGRSAVWRGGDSYMAYQKALHRVRPRGGIESLYLRYYLEYLSLRGGLLEWATGSTIKHLPQEQLRQIPVAIPPLAEQGRIVAVLEGQLSCLEAADGSLSAIKLKLDSWLRLQEDRAVMGLTSVDCEELNELGSELHAILELRQERVSKRRREPVGPVEEVPNLPVGWVTASVDQVCWNIEYGTSAKAGPKLSGSDIPVFRMGNIKNGKIVTDFLKYLPDSHPDLRLLMLDEGDVLFNRTNSFELVGKSAPYWAGLGPATFASYLIRCRLVPGVESAWLSLVINSRIGRAYVRSVASQQVGQANVNGSKLAALPVPLPPLVVQRKLLSLLAEAREQADRLRQAAVDSERRRNQLKNALLSEAFAGRLVPQDPKDEPASELLARIRAERAVNVPKQRARSRRTSKDLPAPPTRVTGDDYQQETLPL